MKKPEFLVTRNNTYTRSGDTLTIINDGLSFVSDSSISLKIFLFDSADRNAFAREVCC
jgi:hypothetical protein